MSYLCRQCYHPVEINPTENTAYCANCAKELTPKETLSSWSFKARISQLEAMHELMKNANDEEIYLAWITYGAPDEAEYDDFAFIAMNDELYNDCFDLCAGLMVREGNKW